MFEYNVIVTWPTDSHNRICRLLNEAAEDGWAYLEKHEATDKSTGWYMIREKVSEEDKLLADAKICGNCRHYTVCFGNSDYGTGLCGKGQGSVGQFNDGSDCSDFEKVVDNE